MDYNQFKLTKYCEEKGAEDGLFLAQSERDFWKEKYEIEEERYLTYRRNESKNKLELVKILCLNSEFEHHRSIKKGCLKLKNENEELKEELEELKKKVQMLLPYFQRHRELNEQNDELYENE